MKNESKHTKGEWRLVSNLNGPDDFHIHVKGESVIEFKHPYVTLNDNEEANAKHIVKCVNLHDELITTIKDMNETMERALGENHPRVIKAKELLRNAE